MTHYFKVSVLGCLVLDSRFCRSYGALWTIRGIEQGLRFASPPAYALVTPMVFDHDLYEFLEGGGLWIPAQFVLGLRGIAP